MYFSVHFVSYWMSLDNLQVLHPPILGLLDKIHFQKSHLGLARQKICEAQSQQQGFLLVGTDVGLIIKNPTILSDGALLYVSFQMKVLVYTQYRQI